MKNVKMYEASDKMITLIKDNYSVLQTLGAFGINLGFGDMTVSETCRKNGVDTYTFLAVVNFTINDYAHFEDDEQISVPTLLHYLKASHTYYLDFQLPFIRRELQESINEEDALGRLIMKLYEEYAQEIRRHMKYEEKTLFPYVESLLEGRPLNNYNIDTFSRHHEQTDKKLRELKLMMIKYLPADAHHNNQMTATLYDIYKAVGSVDEAEGLFHFHEQPNPDCPVGRNIHKVLDQRLLDAQRAMEESLRSTTLADIAEDTRQAVNNE